MATEFYENAFFFSKFLNKNMNQLVRNSHILHHVVPEEDLLDLETEQGELLEHPLETPWTFWCDRTARGATTKEYLNSLKMIRCVETVEQFWQVYHYLPPVEELGGGVNYHIMRDNRQPMWEDIRNKNGGTWRLRVNKQHSASIWQEVIMAAVGEQLRDSMPTGDKVVGVSISIKERDDIIQIWNDNQALSDSFCERIAERIRHLYPQAGDNLNAYYKPNQAHIGTLQDTKNRPV